MKIGEQAGIILLIAGEKLLCHPGNLFGKLSYLALPCLHIRQAEQALSRLDLRKNPAIQIGAAGISFFNKRHLQKELKQYMKDLCLLEYAPENETEQTILLAEWENFAKVLLASCTGSKTYCSTLFGIVPIKDASVARKIAEEIDFVTRTYPQKLELADEFAPFREVMVNTYCNMIENGSSYWYEVVNS